jgi:hypothetical protein
MLAPSRATKTGRCALRSDAMQRRRAAWQRLAVRKRREIVRERVSDFMQWVEKRKVGR